MSPDLSPIERFAAGATIADLPLDDMMAAFHRDGAFIAEGLFAPDVIDQMLADADRKATEVEPGSATQGFGEEGKLFAGQNTIRFSSLGKISAAYFKMLDNERYAALADAVLVDCPGKYWVNTGQVMYIGPGEPAQVLHRDASNWWEYVKVTWPNGPEITVSAMIGLVATTEELGATRVVPGSHRWTDLERFTQLPSVPAELGPGDALIYSGYVLHGGGENRTTDQWRKAMHLSFVAGWLTPEESCAIDFTHAELQVQSPRVQRLLGHRSYNPSPSPGGGLWLRNVSAIEEAPHIRMV